jgi:F-type H+-transporting ATPase subunit epsilon
MATDFIHVSIVTPNDSEISCDTDFVVARLDSGEMGFLINHTPVLGKITRDYIRYKDTYVIVENAIVDFNDNILTVIAQNAEVGTSVSDAIKNLEEKKEKYLKESKRKLVDFTEAERDLAKSIKEAGLRNFAK